MWEKLKVIADHPAVRFLKKLCGDPVQLYAVFLVMTVMDYYHSEYTWLYTLLSVFVSFVLMRFYDFVARKGFLGSICYLVYLFAGLYAVNMITTLGQQSYPISFGVWFLTPQSVVDFSLLYTIAIYILMIGFLTSTVYYFAKVRYRMTMQFLIMLIPLSLYAKEGLQMTALLVILLLASYFLLMVYCRQLRETDEVRQVSGLHSGISIAVYVTAFSVLAAIVPKPAFQADREFIDNAMSFSSWSDILMGAISMFTETTDNTVAVTNNTRTLYYVNAPEPLRLRTQTYTYYGEDDSWTVSNWDRPEDELPEGALTYKPQALLQAIADAAAEDADFAAEYGLKEIAGMTLPGQRELEIDLFTPYSNFRVLPSPTRSYQAVIDSGSMRDVRISDNNTFALPASQYFGTKYYPDSYARSEAAMRILQRLDRSMYDDLLYDAVEIAFETGNDEDWDVLYTAYRELSDAKMLLYIADEYDWHDDVIDDLAAELTEGLTSDMDKALAIERYFTDMGYVYDDSYEKAEGENVADFLTTSHRGVCYEFATAMVLLCRSAGLPARYVQGYNMSQQYASNIRGFEGNYLIKARDAHAFPEVYISGYGWVSFEPTVASMELEDGMAENQNVMRWGFVILGIALLAGVIWLMMPMIREKRFRSRILKMTPQACASAVFCRMRWQLKLPDSTTVCELLTCSAPFCTEGELFTAIDELLYHDAQQPPLTEQELAAAYVRWQDSRKAYEKQQKQEKKARKKRKET